MSEAVLWLSAAVEPWLQIVLGAAQSVPTRRRSEQVRLEVEHARHAVRALEVLA